MQRVNFHLIEKKWQNLFEKKKIISLKKKS